MHGIRRDARCVVLLSDTMRMVTRPFSNRHDAMVMCWPSQQPSAAHWLRVLRERSR